MISEAPAGTHNSDRTWVSEVPDHPGRVRLSVGSDPATRFHPCLSRLVDAPRATGFRAQRVLYLRPTADILVGESAEIAIVVVKGPGWPQPSRG